MINYILLMLALLSNYNSTNSINPNTDLDNIKNSLFQNKLTLLSPARLDNIKNCIEDIIKNQISGDLIETGIWRGGSVIYMKAVLNANNISDKIIWGADSFQGFPIPQEQYDKDITMDASMGDPNIMKVSLEQVKNNFNLYGLLDKNIKFLKGWFHETLPNAPIGKLSLLRLDGDYYESTMCALINLYPKLSVGRYIIIDDYGHFHVCAKAVNDYRRLTGINEEIKIIDYTGVYWKKTH